MRSLLYLYALGAMATFGYVFFTPGNSMSVRGRDVLWAIALVAGVLWPLTWIGSALGYIFRKQIARRLRNVPGVKVGGSFVEHDK